MNWRLGHRQCDLPSWRVPLPVLLELLVRRSTRLKVEITNPRNHTSKPTTIDWHVYMLCYISCIMALATRVKAITTRVEVIATSVEAITTRLEAIATRVEARAIAIKAVLHQLHL